MAPTSQERWYFPGLPKVTPPKVVYFEKCGSGTILRCQVMSNKFFAFVWGDDKEIADGFSGANAEDKAVKHVEALGYVQSVDWQLPPPAK